MQAFLRKVVKIDMSNLMKNIKKQVLGCSESDFFFSCIYAVKPSLFIFNATSNCKAIPFLDMWNKMVHIYIYKTIKL